MDDEYLRQFEPRDRSRFDRWGEGKNRLRSCCDRGANRDEYDGDGFSQTPQVSYLTNDHLGSPRITTDANGQVISRRDFQPFGEEIARANYGTDNVRQKFTSYERDDETNLDFAKARFYGQSFGRFMTPDPLLYSASRSFDPQQFNLYVYVRNNPLNLVDRDGKKPTNLRANSVDEKGKLIKLTKADRKILQENLAKLAPGTKVKKNGEIVFKGNANASKGTQLITGLINGSNKTTIAVNHHGKANTDAVDSNGLISKEQLIGGRSDARVYWDPNAIGKSETRTDSSSNSTIVEVNAPPEIILGHELIHAYNRTTREGEYGALQSGKNTFSEGSESYFEESEKKELRATGLGYNKPGDITEKQLREELGYNQRTAYSPRDTWSSCGGEGVSLPCN